MPVNHVLLSAVGRPLPTAVPAGQPQCTIYDAHNTARLPGGVVRTEGKWPTRDLAVDEAYDGLGDTYNLYWQVYQRNSIDDQGLPLDATVHFDQHYDNAFWNGERVVFGDADGLSFNRFTISVDVIEHELTHGVDDVGPDGIGRHLLVLIVSGVHDISKKRMVAPGGSDFVAPSQYRELMTHDDIRSC